jgi:hypothetical protein
MLETQSQQMLAAISAFSMRHEGDSDSAPAQREETAALARAA